MTELFKIKKKLKKTYLEYRERMSKFECGTSLAEHIDPELKVMADEIDQLYKQCKELEAAQ